MILFFHWTNLKSQKSIAAHSNARHQINFDCLKSVHSIFDFINFSLIRFDSFFFQSNALIDQKVTSLTFWVFWFMADCLAHLKSRQ